jgi:hypothetical protein
MWCCLTEQQARYLLWMLQRCYVMGAQCQLMPGLLLLLHLLLLLLLSLCHLQLQCG